MLAASGDSSYRYHGSPGLAHHDRSASVVPTFRKSRKVGQPSSCHSQRKLKLGQPPVVELGDELDRGKIALAAVVGCKGRPQVGLVRGIQL